MKKFMQKRKRFLRCTLFLLVAAAVAPLAINGFVMLKASRYFYKPDDADALQKLNADCILVLGAGVHEDGTMSHMLEDRVACGISLFQMGAGKKLLMSGDHGRVEYDEVNAMKNYAKENGIAGEDIFMDHAGFSTYESMFRAKEVFGVKTVLIVTQNYHLYRAVYIARALGLNAYGVASDPRSYGAVLFHQSREALARVKDFGMCILKPKPTFLGEAIPISGSGSQTDDKGAADV